MITKMNVNTVVAVLMAVVSVFSAVTAGFATEMQSASGDANTAGYLATLKRQEFSVLSHMTAYERGRAFLEYRLLQLESDLLLDDLNVDDPTSPDHQEWAVASALASNASRYFSPRYREKDGTYRVEGEQQSIFSEYALSNDIDPRDEFFESDTLLTRLLYMGAAIITFACSFVILTLVNLFAFERKPQIIGIAVLIMLSGVCVAIYGTTVSL